MTLNERALEILRLTKELIEDAKKHENQQVAGLFQAFGDEMTERAITLVELTDGV